MLVTSRRTIVEEGLEGARDGFGSERETERTRSTTRKTRKGRQMERKDLKREREANQLNLSEEKGFKRNGQDHFAKANQWSDH